MRFTRSMVAAWLVAAAVTVPSQLAQATEPTTLAGQPVAAYFDLNGSADAVVTDSAVEPVGLLGDCCCGDIACGNGCGTDGCCGNDACGGVGCCDGVGCGDICGGCCGNSLLGDINGKLLVLPELLLGGLFCPTQCGFDDFISPMTNPLFFEDPRTLTELRGIYAHHKVPLTALGGEVNYFALQIRAALNDRLSIIATKDGYIQSDNPLIQDGWADVAAGLKYQLLADRCCGQLLATGFTFDMPVGSTRSQQGNGDGEFHLFLTGGSRIGRCGHWLSASGFRLPVDSGAESQMWYWSNHFDTKVAKKVYAFTEFNWYHWMKSGNGGVPGVEGLDLFNLGSSGVAGNDIVTGAVGLKVKPNRLTEVGVAFEVPLTDRRDILDNRLTLDLILRY